ncbi:cytochrome P450 [Mycena olivaceomarginata]|nr:cytochrome P450 [Mycena olivaceomarginata]
MNPAFGVAQIRAVTEIFVEKAAQLRDIWARQAEQQNGAACVEGFNYQFDALENNGKSTELDEVFTKLSHSPQANSYAIFRLSQAIMPILRLMPGPGRNLVRAARNQIKADIKAAEGEKSLVGKRDLLSTLLKSNLSTTIPETQRLNDIEIISEIPTFFFAGHETTSSATAWALYALSVNTAAQTKLREELLTIETMRVHAPVISTQRMAIKDDVLPLSKPYIDREGRVHDSLVIPKGQRIHIPILAINTDKEIWGEDATEFKSVLNNHAPERWENIPASVSDIPGAEQTSSPFFAGPHNVSGSAFPLVEMKALLFTLIRAFEFEQAVPKGGIGAFYGWLDSETHSACEGKGSGLPLIVKPYNMKLRLLWSPDFGTVAAVFTDSTLLSSPQNSDT